MFKIIKKKYEEIIKYHYILNLISAILLYLKYLYCCTSLINMIYHIPIVFQYYIYQMEEREYKISELTFLKYDYSSDIEKSIICFSLYRISNIYRWFETSRDILIFDRFLYVISGRGVGRIVVFYRLPIIMLPIKLLPIVVCM